MKRIIYLVPLFLLFSSSAFGGVDPSSLVGKIYKAYMSTNSDCSSPVVIFNAETDTTNYPDGYAEVDFVANPTIGTGSMADGTYKCVIFKMSDLFTMVPATSDGDQCVAGTSYTYDTCCAGTPQTTQNAETGAQVTCADAYLTEDTIWVYISTDSVYSTSSGCNTCNGQLPPTEANPDYGYKLDGQVEVASDITGTLVFNLQGKVVSDTEPVERCASEPPEVSFRTSTE